MAKHDNRRTRDIPTTKVRTLYAAPKKGQRTAALHVVIRSHLPECAKRVFSVMVWHANQTDGRCDPSHDLLTRGTGSSLTSVKKGIKALLKAGFITKLRKARPHHSAAYQIQWNLLIEMQQRWEAQYGDAMLTRRRARDATIKTYQAGMRTFRSSDVILGQNKGRDRDRNISS